MTQALAVALALLSTRTRDRGRGANSGKHGARIPQTVLRNPSHPLAVDARLGAAKQTEIQNVSKQHQRKECDKKLDSTKAQAGARWFEVHTRHLTAKVPLDPKKAHTWA